jgi:hypothetical protein
MRYSGKAKGALFFALLAGFVFVVACCTTVAEESKKAVTVMFTNDVLGEYAPCG